MSKKILLGLPCFLALAIQAIRPEKNLAPSPGGAADIVALHSPPPGVQRMLRTACYDCHSNRTRYPWYAEIQPLSWWLARHVRHGKKQLNFSEFGRLAPEDQQSKLEDCIDEISEHRMPLRSYRLAHPDARLSQAQIDEFTAWADATIKRLDPPPGKP